MSKYGLMYQGSKNRIAEKIIDLLPPADNLYDLFAGGCAITHCALLNGKYKHIYANDICDMPKLFMDAINGKYANEDRWISRDEFFANIDDPYMKSVWSFGGVGTSYMYSKKLEPFKKALWFAIMFNDWTDFEVLMPETVSRCKNALIGLSDKKDRRLKLQRELTKYVKENEAEGNHNWMMHPLYSQIKRRTYQGNLLHCAKKLESLKSLESLERLETLQSQKRRTYQGDLMYYVQNLEIQSLERLESLQSIESANKKDINDVLTICKKSYEEVPILPNSVIYCDIPYYSTAGYNKSDFDYDKFYDWCMKQTAPIYISEYWMPEDRFECVMTTEVVRKCSAIKCNKVTEKLFIPKNGSSISKS